MARRLSVRPGLMFSCRLAAVVTMSSQVLMFQSGWGDCGGERGELTQRRSTPLGILKAPPVPALFRLGRRSDLPAKQRQQF